MLYVSTNIEIYDKMTSNIDMNNLYDIFKLIEIGKNQTKTILKVDSISYNIKIKDDRFVFNRDNYNGYYIEEL